MMKRYVVLLAFAAFTLGLGTCNSNTPKNTEETAKPKGKYYCTMHPDIISDQPGTCSKCGMDLAERDTTGNK